MIPVTVLNTAMMLYCYSITVCWFADVFIEFIIDTWGKLLQFQVLTILPAFHAYVSCEHRSMHIKQGLARGPASTCFTAPIPLLPALLPYTRPLVSMLVLHVYEQTRRLMYTGPRFWTATAPGRPNLDGPTVYSSGAILLYVSTIGVFLGQPSAQIHPTCGPCLIPGDETMELCLHAGHCSTAQYNKRIQQQYDSSMGTTLGRMK